MPISPLEQRERTRWMERLERNPLHGSPFNGFSLGWQLERAQSMKCSRCGGYLAIEPSMDFYQPEGRWRCVNCGAHMGHVPRGPKPRVNTCNPLHAYETTSSPVGNAQAK